MPARRAVEKVGTCAADLFATRAWKRNVVAAVVVVRDGRDATYCYRGNVQHMRPHTRQANDIVVVVVAVVVEVEAVVAVVDDDNMCTDEDMMDIVVAWRVDRTREMTDTLRVDSRDRGSRSRPRRDGGKKDETRRGR